MPVVFNEANHTYTSQSGENYISATTLLKKYTPEFDENYWSSYKAIKDVCSDVGADFWSDFKKKSGGWQGVVEYTRGLGSRFPLREQAWNRKQSYLQKWEEKRETSSSNGRAFHLRAQNSSLLQEHQTSSGPVKSFSGIDMLLAQNFVDSGLYTELLLYNDKYKVAGQADWVLKEGKWVTIRDYKTSEQISTEAFMEETLHHPLHEFPNASFYKYSIQLSIYGYILESHGYKVRKMAIEHVFGEDYKESKDYPVVYRPEVIHNLFEHYAEKQRQEIRKAIRKSG